MDEVFNVGKTLLLDGQPLSMVTPAGVAGWIDLGIKYSCRYDQVRDPLDGQMKYRCIYEKEGAEVPFVLVNSPSSGDGRVILFDSLPASTKQAFWPDNANWDEGVICVVPTREPHTTIPRNRITRYPDTVKRGFQELLIDDAHQIEIHRALTLGFIVK